MNRRVRPRVRRDATLPERLEHYTDTSAGPGGCWPWTGARSGGGYGYLWWRGRSRQAHRLSFAAANGSIPAGAFILHRCDNPRCVNPAHLFAGSHADNMRDMFSKGRGRLPAGRARPTAEIVL